MALENFKKTSMRIDKANQRFLDYQNAKVGDVNGRELFVQITNNGVVEDQTGTTLKLNWQHENGNQDSTSFNAVDIKTGKYSLYYPKEMLYKGTVDASVEINSNGQITNTMNFKIIVHADVFNGEAGTVNGVFISLADVNKKLDDREKEYVELKERQTSVESQFDAIQQDLTDKDVISAPEIIAARDGMETLGARLDGLDSKIEQDVTKLDIFKKRDGERDDTARMQRIFDYASANNLPVNLDGGLYYVFMLKLPVGLSLNGNGATFKKPNLSSEPYNMTANMMKWQRIMNCTGYTGDVDSPLTSVRNLTFDGNCWEMWDTPNYAQQQASLLYFDASNATKGRLLMNVDNCHFKNNVADGIHVRQNVYTNISNITTYDCFRGGLTITGGYSKINVTNMVSISNRLSDGIDVEIDGKGYGETYAIELNFNNIMIDNDFDVGLPDDSVCNMNNIIISKEKGSYALGVGFNSVLNVTNSQFALKGASTNFNRLLLSGVAKFKNCQFYIKERETNTDDDSALYIFSYQMTNTKGVVGKSWTAIFDDCHFSYLGSNHLEISNVGIRTSNSEVTTVITNNCTFDNTLSGGIVSTIQYLHTRNNRYDCRSTGIHHTSNRYNVGNQIVIDNPILLNDEIKYLTIDGANANIKHLNTVLTDKNSRIVGNNVVNSSENASYYQKFIGNRLIYTDIDPNKTPYVYGVAGDIAISTTPVLDGGTKVWKCTRTKRSASPYNPTWVEITDPNLVVGVL